MVSSAFSNNFSFLILIFLKMYVCDRCQMGLQVGMNVSHAHNRTKKRSLPNLHVITVKVDGKNQTMRLCTKCTRIVRKKYPYSSEPVVKEVKKEEAKNPAKKKVEEAAPVVSE
jgi:large subunit ribosomal protein L28